MTVFYVIWIIVGALVAIDFCSDIWNFYKFLDVYVRLLLCLLPFTMCTLCWPIWVFHEAIESVKTTRKKF